MSIDLSVIEAFEAEIDKKLDNARRLQKLESSHLGQVVRVDSDGTPWVHIFGGAKETPIRNSYITAKEGDLVNVNIAGGSASITGSSSSPAASTYYVDQANRTVGESLKAQLAAYLGDIVQIKQAIIDQATIDDLLAHNATIQNLIAMDANINNILAGRLSTATLDATYAQIDLANMHEAEVDQLSVINILGQSGLFDNLVLNEGSVTGTLKAVTILGDLIKANTVFADRLVYPGSDGMYYMLNYHGGYYAPLFSRSPQGLYEYDEVEDEYVLTEDVVINPTKAYYSQADDGETYIVEKNVWYELNESNQYVLTEDTSVVAGKSYYEYDEAREIELSESKYQNALDGSRIVAKSVTAGQIDTESLTADSAFIDSLKTILLMAQIVQIGGMGSTHVEMRGNRFSFFAPGYSYDYAFEQDPDYVVESNKAMPGEVAYIAVDDETQESMFYITRAVVVKDLRFGNWKWYDRSNGNLALKWIGGSL